MQLSSALRTQLVLYLWCAASLHAQGLGARANAGEYLAQTKAGDVTIAAEFKGHSVSTIDGTFLSEDYVVVEAALFGAAEARVKLSLEHFSLRINGKKSPTLSEPPGLVFKSLKDPEWVPPEGTEKKSKSSLGTGGGNDSTPVTPPKMPFPLRRAMEQKVQKASFPEGERPLPQAGLLYFQYRGKAESVHSLELIYEGPAGKAALALQP
jgi:hypothetical protein